MNNINKVYFGDCRESLKLMKEIGVKVQTCVTSPPYFGLRDYGHDGQIGLEETPEQYITAMVEVFRCVRDVLSDDGTLWVNIGDSYAANRTYQVPSTNGGLKHSESQSVGGKGSKSPSGLKQKDLIGIPWMLAFALRADGWYLRQDIIWKKNNPMPESVTDRCTKSHEYIFLLSKSQHYYYDNEAIKEPCTSTDTSNRNRDETRLNNTPGRTRMGGLTTNHYTTRNKRSVWEVNTKPYSGAHFAVYPIELIEPCILAGARLNDVVLDPFMGSGTTAAAAILNGRQFVGCELNEEYKVLQDKRILEAQFEYTRIPIPLFIEEIETNTLSF